METIPQTGFQCFVYSKLKSKSSQEVYRLNPALCVFARLDFRAV